MSLFYFVYVSCWAFSLSLVAAHNSPLDPNVQIRNAPGKSDIDTIQAIRRAISAARIQTRDPQVFKNSTTLDRSWDGATLLRFGLEKTVSPNNSSEVTVSAGVEITCKSCYIKGIATAQLTIDGDFNASQALHQTLDDVRDTVLNITKEADDYLEHYLEGVVTKLGNGFDLSDFAFPTFNHTSLDIDIDPLPECQLRFQFDGMELYVLLDTTLSLGATYTLNLYSSNTAVGISVSKDLEIGIIFSIDLILSAAGEIDIRSGFHIKLEDGIAIDIPLFANNVSNIAFNGGQFEFLPVTIESAGIELKAVLRMGVHAGLSVITPDTPELTALNITLPHIPPIGGGIEVGVFANVAEFITNVTYAPDDEECQLHIEESYQIALGAAAGATIALGTDIWGPVAATSIPIFYTTFVDACAIKMTPTETPTPVITARRAAERREDLTTTVIATEATYTGVTCKETTLVNCPASLQATSRYVITKTLTTSVASGVKATFPESTFNSVSSTIAFGSSVQKMSATSGSPVSYVPPPPTPTPSTDGNDEHGNDILKGKVGGVDKKTVIGVSVGLGVFLLAAIVAGLCYFQRRKRYTQISRGESIALVPEPYSRNEPFSDKGSTPGKSGVNVTVVESR